MCNMNQKMPVNQPNPVEGAFSASAHRLEPITFQPWNEIIGTVQQVGKVHIMLLCSKEFMIKCSRQTIHQYRHILKKGALVGILKTEREDPNENNGGSFADQLRIRDISRSPSAEKEGF